MRFVFFILVSFITFHLHAENVNLISPPAVRPVRVDCNFFLVDIVSILEKEETFVADIYFSCQWDDPRLSYTSVAGAEPKIFLDEKAQDQLKEMWWPQIEFLNAGNIIYDERSLFIHPDGRVEYYVALTGSFRTHLDLTRFPFDRQVLEIKIDSFLWNKNVVELVPATENTGFRNIGNHIHNDEKIADIKIKTELTKGLQLHGFGDSDEYSTYVASIVVERKPGFFIYQLFVPLFSIMGISCTVFFAYKSDYMQIVAISIASFLVFLAAKFTLNADLPRVGYMTVIDKAFLVSYITIGLQILICTLREIYGTRGKEWANRLCFHGAWVVPLVYTSIIIWIFMS